MHQHVATPPQMMCHFVATMVLILVEAMVRGYHVYKDTWATAVGEQLPSQRQDANFFAVAVVREEAVVGHVSKKISCNEDVSVAPGSLIHVIPTGIKA